MAVYALDRLQQLTLGIRLQEAANGDFRCARVRMAGRKEGRHPLLLGMLGKLDAGLLFPQAYITENEVNLLPVENVEGVVEVIDRRDDLVSGVAQHIFIIERCQRLILDDEDTLDDLLTLPEQHLL